MLRGRPLRFGGERIRWWSIPQVLVFLRHDDSCVLNTDLVEVDAWGHRPGVVRAFKRSDPEDLRIGGLSGAPHVSFVFEFGGFLGRGLYSHNGRIGGRSTAYGLHFSRVGL